MAETLDWSKKTYLVIDDFSIVHRMLREMLRKFGATLIDTAKNGPEAIALLARRQYDVILCDYNFSEGPNGQQILEEARHRDLIALTSVWIMVSSEKAVETVMGAAEQAPDGYILKPLTESTLLSRLNRAADRKRAFFEIDKAYAARDFRKAIELCEQRLVTHRLHAADLLRMKASLLVKCGEIQQARTVYEQALSIRDQVWAKTGLAKLHYVSGQYSPAKFLLYEVIATNPSYLDAYDYLAQTLQKLGDVEEALQVLETAASLSPYSVVRQNNLGDLAFKMDKLEMAERAYTMSIDVGEYSVFRSPTPYLGLARVHARKKRLADALQVIDAVRQSFDGEQVRISSGIVEAQAYLQCKQADKARQLAQALQSTLAPSPLQFGEELSQEMMKLFAATGIDGEAPKTTVSVHNVSEPGAPPASRPTATGITEEISAASRNVTGRSVTSISAPVAGATATDARTALPVTPSDMPDKARALFNRANVLLQFMQRQGYNSVSAEETRSVIARMEKIIPGDARVNDLYAALNAMIPS